MNATSLLLEPLGAQECADLMDSLVPDTTLDAGLRERITVASAGNPLYVEEMLAMVREHGGDREIVVPPTIHALLQARLDSLDTDVRVVMERGSVEGEVFHRGAVAELSPDLLRSDVGSHLATLVRKELIRSTPATFPEDEGFRFRHLLIRDTAYDSLPKATRAELHERFAGWLAVHDLVESDEIVGYHLEQAHSYRTELDPSDTGLSSLAARAAEHLAAAGHGAIDRGDWGAARVLLRRTRTLLPAGDDRRAAAAVELTYVLLEGGELSEAKAVAQDALSSEDPVVRARGVLAHVEAQQLGEGLAPEHLVARRAEARAVLEDAGDDLGLARYWRNIGFDSWAACQAAETRQCWEEGLRHARAAGAVGLARDLEGGILSPLVLGPTPVPEAVARVEEILERASAASVFEASALQALAMFRAMEGRVESARELFAGGLRTIRDAGHTLNAAGSVQRFAFIERRAGDDGIDQRIEAVLRDGFEELERVGDRSYLPTVALELASCLVRQDRDDEARALLVLARERTLPEDTVNFIYLDAIGAMLAARQGRLEEAEQLARRSLDVADTTDFYALRGMRARGTLAEVLALGGKRDEAAEVAAEAVAVHDAKGDVAGVAALREQLARAGVEVAGG